MNQSLSAQINDYALQELERQRSQPAFTFDFDSGRVFLRGLGFNFKRGRDVLTWTKHTSGNGRCYLQLEINVEGRRAAVKMDQLPGPVLAVDFQRFFGCELMPFTL